MKSLLNFLIFFILPLKIYAFSFTDLINSPKSLGIGIGSSSDSSIDIIDSNVSNSISSETKVFPAFDFVFQTNKYDKKKDHIGTFKYDYSFGINFYSHTYKVQEVNHKNLRNYFDLANIKSDQITGYFYPHVGNYEVRIGLRVGLSYISTSGNYYDTNNCLSSDDSLSEENIRLKCPVKSMDFKDRIGINKIGFGLEIGHPGDGLTFILNSNIISINDQKFTFGYNEDGYHYKKTFGSYPLLWRIPI